MLAYTISGFTAALAGMLLTGYTGQAYLGMGDPYLFTSIAAVAIGGASILGGSGHYVGTIAGAFVLTILTGLLPALNLSNGALLIVYGLVILVTVSLASEAFSDIAAAIRGGPARAPPGRTIRRHNAMIDIECVVDAKACSAREPIGTARPRFCGGSTSRDQRSTASTRRPARTTPGRRRNILAASRCANAAGWSSRW